MMTGRRDLAQGAISRCHSRLASTLMNVTDVTKLSNKLQLVILTSHSTMEFLVKTRVMNLNLLRKKSKRK